MMFLVLAFIGIGLFTGNAWAITQTLADRTRRLVDRLAERGGESRRSGCADSHRLERVDDWIIRHGLRRRVWPAADRSASLTGWGSIDRYRAWVNLRTA